MTLITFIREGELSKMLHLDGKILKKNLAGQKLRKLGGKLCT